ncbi:hypothetical protein B7494_g4553 [Chlorociboria aeruginascens]|nr:hypothetical protein B7494_g4553 [Chlorociboria aeruginascens]
MSSNNSSSAPSSGSSDYTPYTVTGSGTNSQGNSYDTRSQPSGGAYHYSNSNGSYYYSNGDGSTYYNSGSSATYTAPDGNSYKKFVRYQDWPIDISILKGDPKLP